MGGFGLVWEGYRDCGASEAAQSVSGWESSEGPSDVGWERVRLGCQDACWKDNGCIAMYARNNISTCQAQSRGGSREE